MLAARVEYKDRKALRTIAAFLFGDEEEWYEVASRINAAASPREILAAALRMAARDTLRLDDGVWEDVADMVHGTLNNVKYDMGEALGNNMMFFQERPNNRLDGACKVWPTK